jgi:hypothetical protein
VCEAAVHAMRNFFDDMVHYLLMHQMPSILSIGK